LLIGEAGANAGSAGIPDNQGLGGAGGTAAAFVNLTGSGNVTAIAATNVVSFTNLSFDNIASDSATLNCPAFAIAYGLSTGTSLGFSAVNVHAVAQGLAGGTPTAGNSAFASASGVSYGPDPVTVEADAIGGDGTPTNVPRYGGIGGDATVGNVFGSSNGGNVSVIANATGGNAGQNLGNNGGNAIIDNAAGGTAPGATFTLQQTATGGIGGYNGGNGGDALSSAILNAISALDVNATFTATGGVPGNESILDEGQGGNGTASLSLTSSGNVTCVVSATGGYGASVFEIGSPPPAAFVAGGSAIANANVTSTGITSNSSFVSVSCTARGGNAGTLVGIVATTSANGGNASASAVGMNAGTTPLVVNAAAYGGNGSPAGTGGVLPGNSGSATASAVAISSAATSVLAVASAENGFPGIYKYTSNLAGTAGGSQANAQAVGVGVVQGVQTLAVAPNGLAAAGAGIDATLPVFNDYAYTQSLALGQPSASQITQAEGSGVPVSRLFNNVQGLALFNIAAFPITEANNAPYSTGTYGAVATFTLTGSQLSQNKYAIAAINVSDFGLGGSSAQMIFQVQVNGNTVDSYDFASASAAGTVFPPSVILLNSLDSNIINGVVNIGLDLYTVDAQGGGGAVAFAFGPINTPLPEPSSIGLVSIAAGVLMRRRRRPAFLAMGIPPPAT
jgi:hypothetical protein